MPLAPVCEEKIGVVLLIFASPHDFDGGLIQSGQNSLFVNFRLDLDFVDFPFLQPTDSDHLVQKVLFPPGQEGVDFLSDPLGLGDDLCLIHRQQLAVPHEEAAVN